MKTFIKNHSLHLTVVAGFIALITVVLGTTLPSPYNFRYQINYLTQAPTFICSDRTYSFAADIRGACSTHGSIVQKLNLDGTFEPAHFICNDGSPSWAVVEQGACSGHGGVDYQSDDYESPAPKPFKIPTLKMPRLK